MVFALSVVALLWGQLAPRLTAILLWANLNPEGLRALVGETT